MVTGLFVWFDLFKEIQSEVGAGKQYKGIRHSEGMMEGSEKDSERVY